MKSYEEYIISLLCALDDVERERIQKLIEAFVFEANKKKGNVK